VWNADGTGATIVISGHDGGVTSAAWSPDGRRIVTASDDGTARVWNADGSGSPIFLRGHETVIESAAWSPDGRRIVTASFDDTARVWNADGFGSPIVLRGHRGDVHSAEWSPDGKRIVTTSFYDKTARIWAIDVSLLQQLLRVATTDCLFPDQRQTYLAEGDTEARAGYEACERSHHRTPSFGASKP
jgi:WD40 repeat protein